MAPDPKHLPATVVTSAGGCDPDRSGEPDPGDDPSLVSTIALGAVQAPAAPAPTRAARFEPGTDLGTVRLLAEIGRGATGVVYLGQDKILGREVAVKALLAVERDAEHSPTSGAGSGAGSAAATPGFQRFFDEARAAAAARDPHLVQIYHADVADGLPYLVLEYVRGTNLRQLLERTGPLTPRMVLAVMGDVAGAVAELHARGVIHRDLKPANVLLDLRGHVFVTDFGLAVRNQPPNRLDTGPPAGAVAGSANLGGTPAYMAPETFEGRASARSDIYALGLMTFQLLTSRLPFQGSFEEVTRQHAEAPLPLEPLRERGVPEPLVEVIDRATHKQAMFRYKTVQDFARALHRAVECSSADLYRVRQDLAERAAACLGGGEPAPPPPKPELPGSSKSLPDAVARFADRKRDRRLHTSDDPPATMTAGTPPPVSHPDLSFSRPVPPEAESAPGIVPPPGTDTHAPAVPGDMGPGTRVLVVAGVAAVVIGTALAVLGMMGYLSV